MKHGRALSGLHARINQLNSRIDQLQSSIDPGRGLYTFTTNGDFKPDPQLTHPMLKKVGQL